MNNQLLKIITVLFFIINTQNIVYATTFTWTGTNSSDWSDMGNWNPSGVPGSGDMVIINAAGGLVSTDNGSFTVAGLEINSGGILKVTFNSTLTLAGTCVINAGGILDASQGTLMLNSNLDVDGTLYLAGGPTGTTSGGTIITGGGDLVINGTMVWGGSIGGTGEVQNNGTINVSTNGVSGVLETTLTNSGTINITEDMVINTDGHIINLSTIDIQNNSDINEQSSTEQGIFNQGTIMKTGGVVGPGPAIGASLIQVRLFNNGTVEAQSGQLILRRSGLHGGDFTSTAPGFINFDGNDTLVGGNTIGGSGTAIVDDGGSLFLQGNVNAVNLTMDQGEVYGPGDLTVSGDFNFFRGRLGHHTLTTGDFFANGTLQIGTGASGGPILFTKLVNAGTATQLSTMLIESSSEFVNDGTLDIQNDANLNGQLSSIQILNNGTITKSGTGGFWSEFGSFFVNNGTLNVQAGEVRLTRGAQNNGTINISSGAVLNHTGSNKIFTNASSGEIKGQGEFLAPEEVVYHGNFNPGSSPGILTLTIGSNFTISDSTVFNMEIGGDTLGTNYDHIIFNGTVVIDGTLNIQLINGFVPVLNDTFILIDGTNLSGGFSQRITACTGVDSLQFEIINTGSEIIATVVSITPPATTLTTICDGDSTLIYGVSQKVAGIYYDSLQTVFGCDSILSTSLTINTVSTSIVQNNDTLVANVAGISYQWVDCNNGNTQIVGDTNQQFIPTTDGDYAVIVTQNDCSDTSVCMNVIITGIDENDSKNVFIIYPNPTDGLFNVSFSNGIDNSYVISIRNALGQLIEQFSPINQLVEIDLSGQDKGIYFLNISNTDSSTIVKVIKQ